jgi:3-oxoacyl-[acyl-carrier-protein] synthase II
MSRRVVITGLGLICPLGNTPEAIWSALAEERSGVHEIQSLPGDALHTRVAAEVRHFTGDIENFGPLEKTQQRAIKKALKLMCREIQMGVAAAQLAIHHARIDNNSVNRDRTGVVYGSDFIVTMPQEFTDGVAKCLDEHGRFQFDRWASDGMKQVDPLWLLKYLPNMPNSHIAIYNDYRGPNNALTVREASANLALAEAYTTIARDAADIIVAGATGTRVHILRTLHVVMQEQICSGEGEPSKASRPFDSRRSGMVLGEGAGAFILEELEHAKARGATIYGEVIGYGSSAVQDPQTGKGHHREALRNALTQALRTSGLGKSDVGHIHAHGLSTTDCDRSEALAICDVFGEKSPPIVAAKSYFGNLGAASGLIEAATSVLALGQTNLFPILNFETSDSACSVNAVTDHSTPAGKSFINLNVTPQGQASAIVVRAC